MATVKKSPKSTIRAKKKLWEESDIKTECGASDNLSDERSGEHVDDGSVRGLITNGEYWDVGEKIYLQLKSGDRYVWRVKSLNQDIRKSEEPSDLYDYDGAAKHIVSMCRRKIKIRDIILCSTDIDEEDGIVFTDTHILIYNNETLDYFIDYSEIGEVDYGDDYVTMDINGEEVMIDWSDDYGEAMYNLIMDIKERINE